MPATRFLAVTAALLSVLVAGCNDGAEAKYLLTLIIFHVDTRDPANTKPLPTNLEIQQFTPCLYQVRYVQAPSNLLRIDATIDFSRATAVTFEQQRNAVDYFQHIPGAMITVLDWLKLPSATISVNHEINRPYGAMLNNHFLADGLQERVQKAFKTFKDDVCKGAGT